METMPTLRSFVAERKKQVTAVSSTVESLSATEQKLEARRKELERPAAGGPRRRGDAPRDDREEQEAGRQDPGEARRARPRSSRRSRLEINAVQAGLGAEKKRVEELEARVKNFTELLDRLDNNSKQLLELQTKETEQLAAIDDDLSGLEKERNVIEQSIGAASKVLEKASGEVAIADRQGGVHARSSTRTASGTAG